MSKLVTPHVALGGIHTAYVMPNLIPPITTTFAAVDYRAALEQLAPETEFLMTLYLHESMLETDAETGELKGVLEVRKGAKQGVKGEFAERSATLAKLFRCQASNPILAASQRNPTRASNRMSPTTQSSAPSKKKA